MLVDVVVVVLLIVDVMVTVSVTLIETVTDASVGTMVTVVGITCVLVEVTVLASSSWCDRP